MMHDEAIETYIIEQVAAAYPEIDPAQVIVKFPLITFGPSRDKRGTSIGKEQMNVLVVVIDVEKLDRALFIRRFERQMVTINEIMMEQRFISTAQQDWIEIVKNKGIIFTIQFTYDI